MQIVHGMAEHIERYEWTAEYFTGKGYIVVGDSHLGHGKSIVKDKGPGYFCAQDPATVLVRDEHRLKKLMQQKYPGIPYFILGHSMGSFITRNYLCDYGSGIDGAIIMGTGMQPKPVLFFVKMITRIQAILAGEAHEAKLINKLAFGNYNARIKEAKTSVDWLTKDEKQVANYREDPLCGFVFTVNGFSALFELIWRLHDEKRVLKMPKDLPIFLVAGKEDPVGNYGKAVEWVYEQYQKLGMQNVSMKLYESDRHELLNETDKECVANDIYEWLLKQTDRSIDPE